MSEGSRDLDAAGDPPPEAISEATLGGGCFWCIEAVFEELDGVVSAESGYAGGTLSDPTYQQVCSGQTAHAEVCLIRYDRRKLTFEDLLEVFFRVHDPTQLDRQGHDVGTQYRSVIFFHDDEQKRTALRVIAALNASGAYDEPIVTQLSPAGPFYRAEEYHQDYFRNHPEQGYCAAVVRPKVEKFRQVFPERLKPPKAR